MPVQLDQAARSSHMGIATLSPFSFKSGVKILLISNYKELEDNRGISLFEISL